MSDSDIHLNASLPCLSSACFPGAASSGHWPGPPHLLAAWLFHISCAYGTPGTCLSPPACNQVKV